MSPEPTQSAVVDTLGRPLRNLRLSVTDRCNLRCAYCMPEEEYTWLPREDILDFRGDQPLGRYLHRAGCRQGTHHRRRAAAAAPTSPSVDSACWPTSPALNDLALTTNGILLADAGSVSLRCRRPASGHGQPRYVAAGALSRGLTRRDGLPAVLAGIESAARRRLRGDQARCRDHARDQ